MNNNTKTPTILSLAVDSKAAPTLTTLAHIRGLERAVTRLDLGDPQAALMLCADGGILGFRYQTGAGFLHELKESTLLPAVLRLSERYVWSYMLISGNLHCNDSNRVVNNGVDTQWQWNAVQGALMDIQEAGVGVWIMRGESYLEHTIGLLATRSYITKRVRPPKDYLFVTAGEDMLMSLPGIGEERCEQLLRFAGGSAARALECLTDPAFQIDGIGTTTKQKVRQALRLDDRDMLTVVPTNMFDFTNDELVAFHRSASLQKGATSMTEIEMTPIPSTTSIAHWQARDITPSVWEMIQAVAPIIHTSRLFQVNSPEQAAAIMLKGYEVGLSLAASFELIHNIRGVVSLSPRGALALLHRSQCIDITIEDKPDACTVTMQRRDTGFRYSLTFTLADAQRADLLKQDSGWAKYPANMLRWRAIGFCADVVAPDILAGMKTADQFGATIDVQGNVIEGGAA